MGFKTTLVLVLCVCFPDLSLQQSRSSKSNGKYNGDEPYKKEPSNWKAILIVAAGVLFFGSIIYGTSCFYVCKMHFFERTEKKYMKMDGTHV